MRNTLLSVISSSVVTAAILLAFRPDAPSSPAASTQSVASAIRAAPRSTKAPRDDRAIQELRDDVEDLYARQDDLEQNLGPAPAVEEAPPHPEDDAARAEVVAGRIQDAMDLEPADPRWSPMAEERLRGWAGERAGAQLQELRCSASLCRLVVGFEDVQTRSMTMQAFWQQSPWPAEGFGRALDEEGLVYEVYLARDGRSLPPV